MRDFGALRALRFAKSPNGYVPAGLPQTSFSLSQPGCPKREQGRCRYAEHISRTFGLSNAGKPQTVTNLENPRPATGVSRALRARSVECSRECPRKRGVSEGVSDGVSPGPFGPRTPECPKSDPRVSPECQRGVRTLRGHSRDTFWTLRSPGPEEPWRHPVGHSLGHPPFAGTLSGTLREHFGPKGPERLL